MKATVVCASLQYDGKLYRKGDSINVDIATARLWTEKRYIEAHEVDANPLRKLKVDELIAYAQANGIDLGEAKKKEDILAVITAAQQPPEDE